MNSFSALIGCNHVLCIHKYIPVLKCKLHTAEDFTNWSEVLFLTILNIFLQMKLEIHRTFVENRDGTYDLYEMPKTPDSMDDSFKGKNPMPIRPFELKTFLKVGKCPRL